MLNGSQQSSTPPLPIRVVTFDLDNTLWKTGPTIDAANDALAEFLTARNIVQSQRTEDVMKELFRVNKAAYCPLLDEDADHDAVIKAPVLLTRLRQDALQQILIQDNGFAPQDAKEFAQQAFQKVHLSRNMLSFLFLAPLYSFVSHSRLSFFLVLKLLHSIFQTTRNKI